MNKTSDDQGFQFPGVFEISAMGPADAGLEAAIPAALQAAGLTVLAETLSSRASSAGRFVCVRVNFHAADRGQYEAAHAALRANPAVKWTI
jgi:putative lipoic acid-binding regulatory protein